MADNPIVAQRDTDESAFSEILKELEERCPGFETAVFYDREGETIDYHSFLDPYATRLAAAHIGLITVQATTRFDALKYGSVKIIEIETDEKEYVSIALGENLFFMVAMRAGHMTPKTYGQLFEITRKLREEAGLKD